MTSNGLWDKMHAAARNYRLDCLDKFGIKPNHAIAAGGLGVAKISLISNGFFEFGGELSRSFYPFTGAQFRPKKRSFLIGSLRTSWRSTRTSPKSGGCGPAARPCLVQAHFRTSFLANHCMYIERH